MVGLELSTQPRMTLTHPPASTSWVLESHSVISTHLGYTELGTNACKASTLPMELHPSPR